MEYNREETKKKEEGKAKEGRVQAEIASA